MRVCERLSHIYAFFHKPFKILNMSKNTFTSRIKHFIDILACCVCYLLMICGPIFIALSILNITTTNDGILDLLLICAAIALTFFGNLYTREAQFSHNHGLRYLTK